MSNPDSKGITAAEFAQRMRRTLPLEEPFGYHKRISEEPVHQPRRNRRAKPLETEMAIPNQGWRLVWNTQSSPIMETVVADFADYLQVSMEVSVEIDGRESLADWKNLRKCIIVGTRGQLPECGTALQGTKDYEIRATEEALVVCGYDEAGARHGLFHLEARLNLREAPFFSTNLQTIRHSIHETRMVLSGLGWMEWPDRLLEHLIHDGFDGIFASVYTNPNGDRTTAETCPDFYARQLHRIRHQDPARMRDLIDRASRWGIKVFTPIIYQYLDTPESEAGLRKLVQNILAEFPDIHGYVLLTEGFWYGKWGGGHGASREYLENWAQNWSRAVGIVSEECHRVNPDIEILPWEYNINFRPENADMKRYFVNQLPQDTTPLLTWENGKAFELDGMQGFLRDYSLNQVGPAEVTEAQIDAARKRGMKVYCKADSFASWQYGSTPYLPFPYQWHKRYVALAERGVNGTLESWSSGYKPNFMTNLRAWYCWSDAPPLEEMLAAIAKRDFGSGSEELVLQAWQHFSEAIQLVPDTGPSMGTNGAIGNPLFFDEPPARTATFHHAWKDHAVWKGYLGSSLVPYWPFTKFYLMFCPDFSNRTNKAENYARSSCGVAAPPDLPILPIFLKYLRRAAEEMETGLKLYRAAALQSPKSKRRSAMREVVVAEHLQRMMLSSIAILEFEDLRIRVVTEEDPQQAPARIDRLECIVEEEIERTKLSLLAATRDARLGFQHEQDYVYTPYSLREKLAVLKDTLKHQLPKAREKFCQA